ncbi:MAG: hypothetical protein KGM60_07520 [Comamonadaceae bacterium]|nr:hypothetical protein [Comamonadaceae bacterium]
MTTELEKTQLEIAKLQLEQERHKLAQMQQRQKVVSGLGQGAVAVGGAVGKGGSAVLRYVGRWLMWAVLVEVGVLGVALAAAQNAAKGPGSHGFVWEFGSFLGRIHTPNVLSVLVTATLVALIPPAGKKNDATHLAAAFGTAAAVFAIWAATR